MASTINVKIAPLPRGDYSSSATYAKLDVVSYNGSSYMAIKAVPTGTVPTNTTYWQLLAEKPTIGEGSITTDMLADGAVTADKLDSSVSDKYAEVSGTYEDMVVGSAEQLLSTQYDTDSVPYAFRKSPYGDREFDEIVGGSIAWNQWRTDTDVTVTRDGITTAYSSSTHKISITNNSRTTNYGSGSNQITLVDAVTVGHKYLVDSDKNESGVGITVLNNNSQVLGFVPVNSIFTFSTTATKMALRVSKDYDFVTAHPVNDVFSFYLNIYDLTQMFGSTIADYIYSLEQSTAGSGVAFFRSLFPKPYYAYNAGQLISVSGLSAHKTVGFNALDKNSFVKGRVDNGVIGYAEGTTSLTITETGVSFTTNAKYRGVASGLFNVIPSATYYARFFVDKTFAFFIDFYDFGGNYLSRTALYSPSTFSVPQNAHQARVSIQEQDSGTCNVTNISISINGEENGTYEDYVSHTYSLDDSLTLRGVPKLVDNKVQFDGDIYSSDGTVTRRYKQIQVTSFTGAWGVMTSGNYGVYTAISDYNNSSALTGATQSNRFSLSLEGRPSAPAYSISLGNGASTSMTFILPSTITSLAEANAWLANNPTWVVYQTTTPTTESASPYVSPQICNEYGTEEYVSAEQSGMTMIVGHNTKYPQNLRKKIEGLPWNFSNLIAPTEATNKATRNYTVGSFLIMNNTLYKVTSAIANGGTITVGTNVSATTIMAEILAL
jgi:hypothetical protein